MTPLGWGWAVVVWGCALVWLLVTDRATLRAYHCVDPAKAKAPTNETQQIAKIPVDVTPHRARGT